MLVAVRCQLIVAVRCQLIKTFIQLTRLNGTLVRRD